MPLNSYCAFLLKPKYTEGLVQLLLNYEHLYLNCLGQMSQEMLEVLVLLSKIV